MATFKLQKGEKFAIDKGIQNVLIGMGWKEGSFDLDLNVFGCVNKDGVPTFYNDGSHAVTYANQDLVKGANKSFATADGSITHTGDNRTGKGGDDTKADDESVKVALALLPADINELSIFLTLHEAISRKQTFGLVHDAFIHVVDSDTNAELCRYDLRNEFADSISIQVASLVKNDGKWTFQALGAGIPDKELGDILGALS